MSVTDFKAPLLVMTIPKVSIRLCYFDFLVVQVVEGVGIIIPP